MKPTNEQLEAYKAMAAASPDSMKAKIEANLRETCDKFAGHEDRLEDCMKYLTECAKRILGSKNGEVDNETCYRICRDYFNDEIWAKEAKRKAEAIKKTPEEIVADKNRAIIAENNKKLGIGMAQPIDMFAEAV